MGFEARKSFGQFFRRDSAAASEVIQEVEVPEAITAARENHSPPPATSLVQRIQDLPPFNDVLSAFGGELAVDGKDVRAVAILDVGDKCVVVVGSGEPNDGQALRFAQHYATGAGYDIVDRYFAPPDVIGALHERSSVSSMRRPTRAISAASISETEMTARIDRVVASAVNRDASDIHIRVRSGIATDILFRINGELQVVEQVSNDVGQAMARTIYRLGGKGKTGVELDMDAPQDANVERMVEALLEDSKTPCWVKTNLRFGSVPERTGGANVVLRVIVEGNKSSFWSMDRLGYSRPQQEAFQRASASPDGAIVLVGTTGSGKSRTLQTLLGQLHERFQDKRNIMTVEQPVEYVIPGATQCPVPRQTTKDSGGFARLLRALMRTDPDTIMVGEVRDEETGGVLQQAVQTGHSVLTTLHAKTAVGAAARLVALGVEPEVLCDYGFLNMVAYQRLVPVVCPHCALKMTDVDVSAGLKSRLMKRVGHRYLSTRFRRMEGCKHCNYTSIIGRTVCAEMFIPDRDVLAYLSRSEYSDAWVCWRSKASAERNTVQGHTALDHAVAKMCEGMISPMDVEEWFGPLDGQLSPTDALALMDRMRGVSTLRSGGGQRV